MTYADYEWFLKREFKEYDGQWIAIVNKKVVAHGKSVKNVIEEARRKFPSRRPSITKIRNKLSILKAR